jgi:hypothetical protein
MVSFSIAVFLGFEDFLTLGAVDVDLATGFTLFFLPDADAPALLLFATAQIPS